MSQAKKVIIVRGPSASGKTTWIKSHGFPMLVADPRCETNDQIVRRLERMRETSEQDTICIETNSNSGYLQDFWIRALEPHGWCVSFREFDPAVVAGSGQRISSECNTDRGDREFELARTLHRIVRAMHDGHCPACGHLGSSKSFVVSNAHECPVCGFGVEDHLAYAALLKFRPFYQNSLRIFKEWADEFLASNTFASISIGSVFKWEEDGKACVKNSFDTWSFLKGGCSEVRVDSSQMDRKIIRPSVW